nr:integrase, catalytic region, zinc finger, CCHC-type, peptidase aspartic, catalytic [Tanacetum cinerariifolium]
MVGAVDLDEIEEVNANCILMANLQQASTSEEQYIELLEPIHESHQVPQNDNNVISEIERLQAQLGDLKGKCKDTSCASDTQYQLFQKLENANVELEFRVFNYARENAHLKTTYKNLFDSIYVSRVQTETKIASLQNELQSNIYKNAKLRTQLFKKVSDQKDNNQDSTKNTKFAKQPNVEILSKIGCSKHMTGNLKLLINFVWKFMGTVRFGNDHVVAIWVLVIFSGEIF